MAGTSEIEFMISLQKNPSEMVQAELHFSFKTDITDWRSGSENNP